MQRRVFIAGVAAATAWSSLGRAQQTVPVVGFLNVASAAGYSNYVAAFRDGLRESGYVDGQSVAIEYRWAEGHYERLPDMAADLVRRQVSVIAANTPANLVAKAATDTIPIVFTTAGDPVQLGTRGEPKSTGRQCHRRKPTECGGYAQASGAGA